MWASEITKCFNEGRLGGSGMPTHQELSLPHVGPCGCMLTQTGGGGGVPLNHQNHILPLPHFFPWKLPISVLAEISTQSMGCRYLHQMSVNV